MLTATHDQTAVLEKTRGYSVIKPERMNLALLRAAESKPSLLLVEDDPKIALALKIRLTSEGYEVTQAPNVAFGLMCAFNSHKRPDLVIMDIMLPGIDGIRMAESLKESRTTRDLPLIFVTGTRDPQTHRRAKGLEPVAFFEKPFDFPDLLKAIEEAI